MLPARQCSASWAGGLAARCQHRACYGAKARGLGSRSMHSYQDPPATNIEDDQLITGCHRCRTCTSRASGSGAGQISTATAARVARQQLGSGGGSAVAASGGAGDSGGARQSNGACLEKHEHRVPPPAEPVSHLSTGGALCSAAPCTGCTARAYDCLQRAAARNNELLKTAQLGGSGWGSTALARCRCLARHCLAFRQV